MSFDPNTFLNTEVSGAMETKYPLIPESQEGYRAVVKKVDGRVEKVTKGPNVGKDQPICDVTFVVDDEGVRQQLQMPEPTIRMSLFLDMNAAGQLELGTGKNIQLGRLREALGQNDPNTPWTFSKLVGGACKIKVKHSPNEKDPSSPFANVSGVAPL